MNELAEWGARLVGQALEPGNRWVLVLAVAVGIGMLAALRGKLTESWILFPLLAVVVWYAVYRWLALRAR